MSINSKFRIRLKELRKEYSMTQQDLSEKIGIVRTAIANYETDRASPDSETLNMIANIFNVSTDYLLGRTDIKNIKQGHTKDPILKDIEGLSEESKKELEKYLELLKIKDQVDKSKDEISSALENEA